MDGSRFDAWTRRRFGLAAGGVVGSLLGIVGEEPADVVAKKKKKKERCRKLGQKCTKGGKRECCEDNGLACYRFDEATEAKRCCRRGNQPCVNDGQCCSGSCENDRCACKSNGQDCAGFDGFCCSLNCAGDTCQPA